MYIMVIESRGLLERVIERAEQCMSIGQLHSRTRAYCGAVLRALLMDFNIRERKKCVSDCMQI